MLWYDEVRNAISIHNFGDNAISEGINIKPYVAVSDKNRSQISSTWLSLTCYSGAHTHFEDISDIHMFIHRTWTLPLAEAQLALQCVKLSDALEIHDRIISIQDCHIIMVTSLVRRSSMYVYTEHPSLPLMVHNIVCFGTEHVIKCLITNLSILKSNIDTILEHAKISVKTCFCITLYIRTFWGSNHKIMFWDSTSSCNMSYHS